MMTRPAKPFAALARCVSNPAPARSAEVFSEVRAAGPRPSRLSRGPFLAPLKDIYKYTYIYMDIYIYIGRGIDIDMDPYMAVSIT